MSFVDPAFAKGDQYSMDIDEIFALGVCPFCPGQMRWHQKPVIAELSGWIITESSHPYENAEHHFLIIGSRHITSFLEVTAKDWMSVRELAAGVIRDRSLAGGGLVVRFGVTRFTGATVQHLHFHLIVPEIDPDTDRAKTVNFPIG